MICAHCGTENKDYYAFCSNCGKSLLKKSTSLIYSEDKKSQFVESSSEKSLSEIPEPEIPEPEIPEPEIPGPEIVESKLLGSEISRSKSSESEFLGRASAQFNHQKITSKFSDFLRKRKKFIITIAIFITGIIIFFIIGVRSSDFKSQAIDYIKSERSCKWDELYEVVENRLPDTEFMTKEMFLTAKSDSDPETISDCQAGGFTLKETGNSYLYVAVNYKQNNDSSSGKAVVTMDKQPNKSMLFFDKYIINADNVVAKNIKFTVSKDSKIYVDGIQLKDSYLKNHDAEADTEDYIIDCIFKGKHTIKVSHEQLIEHEDTINIESGNFSHSYADLTLKAEVIAKLQSEAIETVKKYYSAVSLKKEFNELSSCFMSDPDIQSQIRTQFVKQQETQGTVFSSGATIAALPDALNASTVWQAKYDANNILSTTVVVKATYKPQNIKNGTAVTVELGMLGYRYKDSQWKAYSIICGIGVGGTTGNMSESKGNVSSVPSITTTVELPDHITN